MRPPWRCEAGPCAAPPSRERRAGAPPASRVDATAAAAPVYRGTAAPPPARRSRRVDTATRNGSCGRPPRSRRAASARRDRPDATGSRPRRHPGRRPRSAPRQPRRRRRPARRPPQPPPAPPQETAAIPPTAPAVEASGGGFTGFFGSLFRLEPGQARHLASGDDERLGSADGRGLEGDDRLVAPRQEVKMAALAPVAAARPRRRRSAAAPMPPPVPAPTGAGQTRRPSRSRRVPRAIGCRWPPCGPAARPRIWRRACVRSTGPSSAGACRSSTRPCSATWARSTACASGPFAESGESRQLCATLNAGGFDCLVLGSASRQETAGPRTGVAAEGGLHPFRSSGVREIMRRRAPPRR